MAEPARPRLNSGDQATEPSDVADTSKLNVNDLHVVLEEVHDAHSQWQGIGLQLRLASPVLEGIEQQYSKTEDRLREILKQWLKQATPVPCWDALVEALKTKTVNEPKLAKQLSLSHGILPPSDSNITDRRKELIGQLQDTESQLESYQLLQQSEKVDRIDETPEDALERQQSQDDAGGLRTESERELHKQLKQLRSRIASLEKITGVSELSQRVPDETVTKKLDPLKDEMDQLRTHNSELEEELHSLKDQLAELEEKNGLLSKEIEDLKKDRITLIAETDAEIGKKATKIAKKSADYKSLYDKMQQIQYEAQKQAEELHKLLKSQSADETQAPPEPSDSTEPATVEQ